MKSQAAERACLHPGVECSSQGCWSGPLSIKHVCWCSLRTEHVELMNHAWLPVIMQSLCCRHPHSTEAAEYHHCCTSITTHPWKIQQVEWEVERRRWHILANQACEQWSARSHLGSSKTWLWGSGSSCVHISRIVGQHTAYLMWASCFNTASEFDSTTHWSCLGAKESSLEGEAYVSRRKLWCMDQCECQGQGSTMVEPAWQQPHYTLQTQNWMPMAHTA